MQKEIISSWMDGEEKEFNISQHLSGDSALLERWSNYHLIRDILRKDTGEIIHLDIASKVCEALKKEPLPVRTVKTGESQPSPASWLRFPWKQIQPWATQVTQLAVAASVALAVIVGVQQHNLASSAPADSNLTPVMDTLPIGGFASPVSYGVPADTNASRVQQVQEQRKRINAMLQDYELQRRLHAEQLSVDGDTGNTGAAVKPSPSISEQIGSGTHLQ
ncbi:MAG: RseA family anti-sigma factor [Enterobacteriaceae bacterium]